MRSGGFSICVPVGVNGLGAAGKWPPRYLEAGLPRSRDVGSVKADVIAQVGPLLPGGVSFNSLRIRFGGGPNTPAHAAVSPEAVRTNRWCTLCAVPDHQRQVRFHVASFWLRHTCCGRCMRGQRRGKVGRRSPHQHHDLVLAGPAMPPNLDRLTVVRSRIDFLRRVTDSEGHQILRAAGFRDFSHIYTVPSLCGVDVRPDQNTSSDPSTSHRGSPRYSLSLRRARHTELPTIHHSMIDFTSISLSSPWFN